MRIWQRLGAKTIFRHRLFELRREALASADGEPAGDGKEEIQVESAPLSELPRLVASGEIRHALVVAAFYLFDLHRRSA